MAYGYFKDLAKITSADKVIRHKASNIAKDPKYDGYKRGLASMVYKFFDKKTKGSGLSHTIKSTSQNQQVAEELLKPIIKKLKNRKVHSAFKDNIWGADLEDMQLIRKFNKKSFKK